MSDIKFVQLSIHCRGEKNISAKAPLNGQSAVADGVLLAVKERRKAGCRLGTMRMKFSQDLRRKCLALTTENAIELWLPMPQEPIAITAMTLYNPWWTRPVFVSQWQDIPDRTQIAFVKYDDHVACIIPMVGRAFKATISGHYADGLHLILTAGCGGQTEIEEPLYLISEADSIYDAVHKAFALLMKEKGLYPRSRRKLPEMFRYLGWCSWDAFRTDVTEAKLRQKADELQSKKVPVRWMLIDDGWMSVRNKMLLDFAPDREKFPHGFKLMINDLRKTCQLRWFGVWHALCGYWEGIDPDGPLAREQTECLYHTNSDCLVPSPFTGSDFYRRWYDLLRNEGIEFVKVDDQSSLARFFARDTPVSAAARGVSEAMETGALHMSGAVINCMGMAMENVLARRTTSLSRNSDDFVPSAPNGFTEHLLQNAYNSLWHNEIYTCDWDMFWTNHPDAERHALLRAISGGPVYFSDRTGDTDPAILRPLCYMDGRLLIMRRSAKPTEDCAFTDPRQQGVLKLHNTAAWTDGYGGGLAAYNLTEQTQSVSFCPSDIPDLDDAETYWLYDWFEKRIQRLGRNEHYSASIPAQGYAWYVLLPCTGRACCLGLLEKYAGFTAVRKAEQTAEGQIITLRASGTVGWASSQPPRTVQCNGTDMTAALQCSGDLYRLELPEATDQTELTWLW